MLKAISKFIGHTSASLAITMLLASLFLSSLITNIDELKTSVQASITPELIIDFSKFELSEEELRAACKENPDQEACQILEDPGRILDQPEIDGLFSKIKEFGSYTKTLRNTSIILFILALVFTFLATSSISATLYQVSLYSTISSALAILYYNLIPKFLETFFSKNLIAVDTSSELASALLNAATNWISKFIAEITKIALIIAIIFLILTITFYFIKKAKSKSPDQQSEIQSPSEKASQ